MKKFGRLGEGVVKSNMEVMTQGFERVREIQIGELEARRSVDAARPGAAAGRRRRARRQRRLRLAAADRMPMPEGQAERTPLTRIADVRRDVPREASATTSRPTRYASLGIMAAGSGDTASKYVARRETPLYIPENCTQCMECIAVCPDTALPNCSQDLDTMLRDRGHQLRHRRRRAPEDAAARCRRSRSARAS